MVNGRPVLGKNKKGDKPVVLRFHGEHFVVLLPTHDKATPIQWVQRPAIDVVPASQNLRGAGPDEPLTPKVGGAWLPSVTPAEASSSSSCSNGPVEWLPACTPSVAGSVSKVGMVPVRKRVLSDIACSPRRSKFGRKWLPAGTPGSPRATSVGAIVDHSVVGPKRRKLLGKQASPVPVFPASEECSPKPKVELRVWTCKMPLAGGGICGHRCEGPWGGRQLSSKRANHLASRHAGEDISKAGTLAKRVEIVDASPALPSELRSWTCGVPACSAGLPLFEDSYAGRWARDCAIERHRQTAHPDLTRTQMYASRWADFRKGGQQHLKESKDSLRATQTSC